VNSSMYSSVAKAIFALNSKNNARIKFRFN